MQINAKELTIVLNKAVSKCEPSNSRGRKINKNLSLVSVHFPIRALISSSYSIRQRAEIRRFQFGQLQKHDRAHGCILFHAWVQPTETSEKCSLGEDRLIKMEWDSCERGRITPWPCTLKDWWNRTLKPARVQALVEQDQTVEGRSNGPELVLMRIICSQSLVKPCKHNIIQLEISSQMHGVSHFIYRSFSPAMTRTNPAPSVALRWEMLLPTQVRTRLSLNKSPSSWMKPKTAWDPHSEARWWERHVKSCPFPLGCFSDLIPSLPFTDFWWRYTVIVWTHR